MKTGESLRGKADLQNGASHEIQMTEVRKEPSFPGIEIRHGGRIAHDERLKQSLGAMPNAADAISTPRLNLSFHPFRGVGNHEGVADLPDRRSPLQKAFNPRARFPRKI